MSHRTSNTFFSISASDAGGLGVVTDCGAGLVLREPDPVVLTGVVVGPAGSEIL